MHKQILSVQRCFHPVGQGAFYSERFTVGKKSWYVVYDCGTSQKNVNIKKVIQEYFSKNAKIPFLFISHFDNDHISGVQHILKYYDVDFLFLPLISDAEKLILIADATPKNIFYIGLICNTEETVKNYSRQGSGTRVIYVEPRGTENNISSEDLPRLTNLPHKGEKNSIVSGTVFTFSPNGIPKVGGFVWCFSPFNYESIERSKTIEEYIKKELHIRENFHDAVKGIWTECESKTINEINNVKAIKTLKNGLNRIDRMWTNAKHVNNMSLYSGPHKKTNDSMLAIRFFMLGEKNSGCCCEKPSRCCNLRYCEKGRSTSASGAIYTGDYAANSSSNIQQFDRHFLHWKCNIGVLQLPHHGSQVDFNDQLINYSDIFVASFGLSNGYHHPSPTVIDTLLRHGKDVYFAHDRSGVIQNIEVLET